MCRAETPLGSSHKSKMVPIQARTGIFVACNTVFVSAENWRRQPFSRHFQTRRWDRAALPPLDFRPSRSLGFRYHAPFSDPQCGHSVGPSLPHRSCSKRAYASASVSSPAGARDKISFPDIVTLCRLFQGLAIVYWRTNADKSSAPAAPVRLPTMASASAVECLNPCPLHGDASMIWAESG